MKSGLRKLTLRDIAREAGVSISTVSLVLRESPLVADGTRVEVQGWLDRLGYVRDQVATNLRSRTSQTIGLVLCELTNPFYAELIAGVDSVLDRNGLVAFIAHSGEDPIRQERLIRRLREQNVAGIILSAAQGTDAQIVERLQHWQLPCVQTLRHVGEGNFDYVGPAITEGVEKAVDHLVAAGHRRIAYIGASRETSVTQERLAGFIDAHSRHKMEQGPIIRCPPTREEGARAIQHLLAGENPPTAAVCYNDVCAFGAVIGLIEAGRRPQLDFSIVGFDDIADASLARPALSTVAIDPHHIGEEAAKLLLRRIADPSGPSERIITPSRLVIRDT